MTKPKVFLATPAYTGQVHVQYALALADTQTLLASLGIQLVARINVTNSLLVASRNNLIEEFMNSDCSHILCVDSDLGWPCSVVPKLLEKDMDFVAGLYPSRKDRQFMFRPKYNADRSLVISEKQLIGMEYIPAGFMLIKKEAMQKLYDHHAHLKYAPKEGDGNKGVMLFNTELIDGEFWGEDYVFCKRVREAGIEIWVDPEIQFDHAGVVGSFVECLTNDKSKSQ